MEDRGRELPVQGCFERLTPLNPEAVVAQRLVFEPQLVALLRDRQRRRRLPTGRSASPTSSARRVSDSSVRIQYSRAASSPSHSRARLYGIAPPRSAKPPLRPLAPSATRLASCTRTRSPASASASAAEQPVVPPPTISTSARPVERLAEQVSAWLVQPVWSGHRTMLTRRHHHPVQAFSLDDQARELEVSERRRDVRGRQPGRAHQLIGRCRRGAQRLVYTTRSSRSSSGSGSAAFTSTPSTSSTSRADVTRWAPRRSRPFVPADSDDVISPGTANTSLPSSSARSAVINAPLRSRASTTTTARTRPAMMRFRAGKRHGAGSTPGGYSETTRPRSPI